MNNTNFWHTLPKPIFILAPMEDVTDTVFRQVVLRTGRPHVFFTEFTSVEGMFSKGDKKVNQRLAFSKQESPLVAQIWGLTPEYFAKAATKLYEMGFAGIDINMGCPEKNIIKKGACSGLIKNPSLAKEIILATKEGAHGLPISVKTRIGFKSIETEQWIGFLLEQDLAAITIHGRTAAEMSKVPVHWDEMKKAVSIRNETHKNTLLFANGDVMNLEQAHEKILIYGFDGIMIGRGIFHNIWLFDESINPETKPLKERLEILSFHVQLFEATWQGKKPYQILKKFFKIYLSGFDNATTIRTTFMETTTAQEALDLVRRYMTSTNENDPKN